MPVVGYGSADNRKGSKKTTANLDFDLNCSIPRKIFPSDGDRAERRPVVSMIRSPGQIGVSPTFALLKNLQYY